jgi:hypothetical protein
MKGDSTSLRGAKSNGLLALKRTDGHKEIEQAMQHNTLLNLFDEKSRET